MTTELILEVLQHALGLDEYGRGKITRNRFVSGQGDTYYATCATLVSQGLMIKVSVNKVFTGGDDCFMVTEEGQLFVRKESPSAPKLTRSQKNYRAFLSADTGGSFKEWLTQPRVNEEHRYS